MGVGGQGDVGGSGLSKLHKAVEPREEVLGKAFRVLYPESPDSAIRETIENAIRGEKRGDLILTTTDLLRIGGKEELRGRIDYRITYTGNLESQKDIHILAVKSLEMAASLRVIGNITAKGDLVFWGNYLKVTGKIEAKTLELMGARAHLSVVEATKGINIGKRIETA